MDEIGIEVRRLVDALSPRTAHQYKSYNDRYIQWLNKKGIIASADIVTIPYKELPLSAQLIHWFVLDTLLVECGKQDGREDAEDEDFKIATLKKMISSLKFLNKICSVHGNNCEIDDKYLENVIRLHSHWASVGKDEVLPFVKVSINLWNDNTPSLTEKFFKTCFEKTRFLVDFHFRFMSRLSYEQRSKIKLSQLKAGADGESISIDLKTWSSLQVYLPDSRPQIKSHMPVVVSARRSAFLCPLTSLATYLYLRFYGIKSMTRGDGFPNLLAGSESKDSWLDLPLIRGKSLLDYPRDETLSNYYSSVFRYCQLPYKRRDFFNKQQLEFPTWSDNDFRQFFETYSEKLRNAFSDHVPIDFKQIMNFERISHKATLMNAGDPPKGLLVQLFPEIESYLRQWDTLSKEAQDFLQMIQLLRKHFLLKLPFIFDFFPDNDIFRDPLFQKTDFQAYFHDIIGKHKVNNDSIDSLPGFEVIDETVFKGFLIESSPNIVDNLKSENLVSVEPAPNTNELMNKTFQFTQYQTLTNFQLLINMLTNIFDKLEMKKSSREFMIHQLNLVHDTIKEKISVSKPKDIDEYIKKEESMNSKEIDREDKNHQHGLLAIDGSSSEDEDNDEEDIQEELKFMINELVGERVRSTVSQQMEYWESKIQNMIDDTIERKLRTVSKRTSSEDDDEDSILKRQRLSITPSITKNESTPNPIIALEEDGVQFHMDPTLDSIESVILEWFTPNPDMNNECVHHMNKTHDKSWRSSFEKLYKERKVIVEFYIHLVNEKSFDRYKAVEICESLRKNTRDNDLKSLALYLKDWKKNNSNSFEGLLNIH